MKKIYLISLMFVFHITSFAQTSQEYLTVKGIELTLETEINYVLNQLLNKGFQKPDNFNQFYSETGYYVIKGTFNNIPDCSIQLMPAQYDKTKVAIIGIKFPEKNTFNSLKEEYDFLKKSLSQKYYLHEEIEKFDNDYVARSNSDVLKMNALRKDECKFCSLFWINKEDKGGKGGISLSIGHIYANYSDYYSVYLVYTTPNHIIDLLTTDDL